MKMFKKIFSVVCALGIATSMFYNVHAESITVDDALSLALTDNTQTNNTVNIDIKTSYDYIGGITIYLKVPNALKDYISSWSFTAHTDTIDELIQNNNANTNSTSPDYWYILQNVSPKSIASPINIPENDIFVTATITLTEGGIPSSLSKEARTITIGSDFDGTSKSKKVGGTVITKDDVDYYLKTDDTGYTGTDKNYMNFNEADEDNHVVLPTAGPTEVIPTATTTGKQNGVKIGDGYTGDTDATDMAAAVGVGVLGDGNVHNELLWEVTADIEGTSVTKTHKSTVSVDGDAAYKFGLVIQGLAQSAITAVTAVLQ